jgi:hypothetical protein
MSERLAAHEDRAGATGSAAPLSASASMKIRPTVGSCSRMRFSIRSIANSSCCTSSPRRNYSATVLLGPTTLKAV